MNHYKYLGLALILLLFGASFYSVESFIDTEYDLELDKENVCIPGGPDGTHKKMIFS